MTTRIVVVVVVVIPIVIIIGELQPRTMDRRGQILATISPTGRKLLDLRKEKPLVDSEEGEGEGEERREGRDRRGRKGRRKGREEGEIGR